MVSVTGQSGKYILQPSLTGMHRETTGYISACELWKRELAFFFKNCSISTLRK